MSIHALANTSQEFKIQCLKKRAAMLNASRAFFEKRNVSEVDCPSLSSLASVDAHIDLVPCAVFSKPAYLHSSPEYGMKRLLALGIGDIFQLSHVFRDGEVGSKHNPEFMMCEWYRVGMPFEGLMQETCDFISLFVGDLPRKMLPYRQAFLDYVGLDPFKASLEELDAYIKAQGHDVPFDQKSDTKDDRLSYILSTFIEPQFSNQELTILPYFPPTQAALAKVRSVDGNLVAERFEVFCGSLELANGYHELQDAAEQEKRLIEANVARKQLGKATLPIDVRFIEALKTGLPDCSGVAVGFDRLMMLHCHTDKIADVIAWDWLNA